MSEARTMPVDHGAKVLERLREWAGGPELLALAEPREDVELVGGSVRDLLLGKPPAELDVVVAQDAPALAKALAERLYGEVTLHERFGTARVRSEEMSIDVATRRAEFYPAPGALPQVRAGTPEEDLLRRDFTVNAIAVGLGGGHRGELRHAPHALEDLARGQLRVLHKRSFIDDPTRLLRLARYRARLEFDVEERTAALAAEAMAGGALDTVSGPRLGAELRNALFELDVTKAVAMLDEQGVLAALHPLMRYEESLLLQALDMLIVDAQPPLLVLAALMMPLALSPSEEVHAAIPSLLHRLGFSAAERERVSASVLGVAPLVKKYSSSLSPAEECAMFARIPVEGVVLAAALPGRESALGRAASRWLWELRHVRLQITGEDLLAAGLSQGPEIGRRLQETLAMRLNGELAEGREAELAAALALP